MSTYDLRNRKPNEESEQNGSTKAPEARRFSIEETVGPAKHGLAMQLLRIVCFGIYFFGCGFFIHAAQLLGAPLYFVSKEWYYAWMAVTKQYFGLLITTMTQWWSPTIVRISGDKSVKGLLHQKAAAGLLELDFGERAVLMANHQIYTDWLYLWWLAYTNNPPTHGHIYIILKESLKYIPVIGPAMMFYSFIFMARKWATDQERMRYRLRKLNKETIVSTGEKHLNPMWLLIFPEGTNLSSNTRESSAKFATKSHIPDMKHALLPRSTGLQFCLQELRDTVPYIYDCTIAYEGVPHGGYGADIFTLRSVYFQGRPPKSVNMHWRRYRIKDIPFDDNDAMHEWIMQRWREKDDLLESFLKNGRFPADPEAVTIEGGPMEKEFKTAYINTQVMPRSSVEFLAMFVPALAVGTIARVGVQLADRVFGTQPLFGS